MDCHFCLWTVACQAPLSMEFSWPEYWRGWAFASPGDLPNPGIESRSPALQVDSLPAELPGKPRRALYMWTKEKSWVINSQDKENMSLKNYCMWTILLRLRGQTSLSSLNYLRAHTLKKYQPSLKRPTNCWMVQEENLRGTHCPVDPYFGRIFAGEIPCPSFSFPPFMAGWWPAPRLHFTPVPKALSQGLLHWLTQWLDMQHPETDKDIPESDHCFAPVPLLCSGAARTTSLRIDKKDRRVCLTSQKISPLPLPPSLIHSLPLAGCRPLAGWLFCWDPLPYFLHSLCYRATKQAKKNACQTGTDENTTS